MVEPYPETHGGIIGRDVVWDIPLQTAVVWDTYL